ncbi:TonB-dependent receptor domain-containing protein [Pedobacter insulae]|uniref:Outer membrane receptor proteins, mostly Fe transport n=1 Tax=Pedobacter insulae TaxID=414048 RepID=A0A1I2ZRI3_9SPHI|nr:TonB-dependent receptor [Pedobacter insulae]SFH40119.1 Outer membrane receptor proteins, mostly Fe transport [Pedobacter insulae]
MKYNKKFLFLFVFLIYVSSYVNYAKAQDKPVFSLKGSLTAAQNPKFDEVTVHLLNASDKKLIKLEYSTPDGAFVFEKIPEGSYLLVIQSMNFVKYESPVISLDKDLALSPINLQVTSKSLKEVSVTATKPFVQQLFDKTVINVSSSISAVGNTALEVLAKAPGITIDQNDNISMRGKQGVLVMIDGKQVPMSGQDLANMLKNMQATQIEKIDLVTNPSAKYDAAGNAGIIDIRLKKGTNVGTNANVTMSFGQGKYAKTNPSVNFNHRTKVANVFGSYNYGFNQNFNKLDILRDFYSPTNQLLGSNNYNNYFKFQFDNHNARVGSDFYVNKNIVVGFSANGSYNKGEISTDSHANSFNGQSQSTGTFNTVGTNTPSRSNNSLNLNYRHTIDTTGKELSADFDYARFASNETQQNLTNYLNTGGTQAKAPYQLLGNLGGVLSIKSFKVDYQQQIKSLNTKIELGVKSSWVTSDNDVQFYDQSNGGAVLDVAKSNHFIYDENINAAYLNANRSWKKFSLQLGLRLENTNANGLQVTDKSTFDRNYTQLFPSGYVGYKFTENSDLGLSLSKRINRPSYRQLNPFKVFLDPLTYSTGNPYLKPELSNSFELTHTYKQRYITKLGYSKTTDNILTVLSPDEQPNSVIQTNRNLAEFDYYNLSFGFPVSVGKWLTSTTNALTYYGKYKGNLANTDLDASRVSFNLNSNNVIKFNPTTTAEITGTYQSRSFYGPLDIKANWGLTLGLQKQLLDKKASLRLSVSDVFYTQKVDAYTLLNGYGEQFYQSRDSRVATLSFSYRFGRSQVASSKRTGAADEEKRRAG